jgi:urease accessory protein
MPRAQKVIARTELKAHLKSQPEGASGGTRPAEIADTLLLTFDDRRRQQGFAFGGKGTCVEFDFPEPPRLRTDDLLVLDDGRLAEVVAGIEPVLEVRARDLTKDFAAMAQLLVTLGSRHAPVQILANRIRLQKRPEIEALLAAHGLKGTEIAAPFEPEDEAMGHEHGHDHHQAHDHHHAHRHDHDHRHHDHHGHDHAHGHGHGHDGLEHGHRHRDHHHHDE